MNIDISSNHISRRSGDERNINGYYERFNLNQYYNAVEDEQIYMDEYTTLIHQYNDFIVHGNTMFSRMEQTLRENLNRTLVRQSYYYQQYNDILRLRRSNTTDSPVITEPVAGPISMVAPTVTSTPASTPASTQRIADVFPRLLSRYLNNEMEREIRQPNNNNNNNNNHNNNIFSMLYSIPISVRTNPANAVSSPTNEQINRATINTTFGHIITPVNAICPISRDEFNDDSEITMIRGCNHIFNRSSLREWFVNHPTCPMCRSDIRDYIPSANTNQTEPAQAQQNRRFTPANLSVDSIDNNQMTFSYDIPLNYNNEQIYNNVVNTLNNMIPNVNENDNQDNQDNQDNNENNIDIMDVD